MLVAQNSLGSVCPVPLTVRGSDPRINIEEMLGNVLGSGCIFAIISNDPNLMNQSNTITLVDTSQTYARSFRAGSVDLEIPDTARRRWVWRVLFRFGLL